MQYSPKLKIAMEKIKAIVDEFDLGATVVIHTPGYSEFLFKIDPSYSLAEWQQVGPHLGIRFRSKLADFNGDKAAQQKKTSDTVNMLVHMRDNAERTFEQTDSLLDSLKSKMEIDLKKGDITGHDQQNN